MEFQGSGTPLTQGGIDAAIAELGLSHAAAEIWAVINVETSGSGFLPDRRPKILFERHIFSRQTKHRFDTSHPDISNPKPGGYGPPGGHQYERLIAAYALDADAALKSASWGLGQLMGMHFKICGFADPRSMCNAMVGSEDNQLLATAKFIRAKGWAGALGRRDWEGFARSYNGPNFAENAYAQKLEEFYRAFHSGPMPDLGVRAAQCYLTYGGFDPGGIDGACGAKTIEAIKAFQRSGGLPPDGAVSPNLIAALARSFAR